MFEFKLSKSQQNRCIFKKSSLEESEHKQAWLNINEVKASSPRKQQPRVGPNSEFGPNTKYRIVLFGLNYSNTKYLKSNSTPPQKKFNM